jgi:hypothetical protein
VGQEAEALRADIEQRRENMSGTIDAIEDRVVPSRVIQRRRNDVRGWFTGAKERLMGSAHGMTDQASGAAHSMGDSVSNAADAARHVPDQVQQATAGSPLIAGAVAFGIGALVAALLPETDTERKAVESVQPQVAAAADAVKEAGQHALETAKASGQEAVQDLKESASSHTQEVTEAAKDAGQQVGQQVKETAANRSQ